MPSGDRVNFVVLFQGRTGSSYLTDVLDRHPEVTAGGEWLADLWSVASARGATPGARLHDALRRIVRGCPASRQITEARAFFAEERPPTRVAGFKTKVSDLLDLQGMRAGLEDSSVRAVVMHRENLVKQTVSHLNAMRLHQRTREWNLHDEADRLEAFAPTVAHFQEALRRVVFDDRVLRAFADLLDAPRLELEYGDLLRDRDAWFGSVYDFLEVEPRPIESDVRKNTRDDLRRVLTNFDELRDAYRGTRFETMFDETVGSAP